MVNMSIDNDEQLDKTCSKCKERMESHSCIICGEEMVNPNEMNISFDEELFNKLKAQAE